MLEGENIREYSSERLLYKYQSSASVGGTSGSDTDWTTGKSVSITLSADSKVLIRLQAKIVTSSWNGAFYGNIRIRNGTSGTEIYSNSGQIYKSSGSTTDYIYAYLLLDLTAGTHNLDMQYSYDWTRTLGSCTFYYCDDLRIGTVSLLDVASVRDYGATISCPASTLTTLSTEYVIPQVQRNIRSGFAKTLNSNVIVMANVGCHTSNTAPCVLMNTSSSDSTSQLGIKVYLDGTQVDWYSRTSDSTSTTAYALGCHGVYALKDLPPPEELTVYDESWSDFVGHGYVTVTEDTTEKVSGSKSAKVYNDGTVGSVFYATFSSSDWSAYKGLSFWFKGQGDGTTITHWLLCPDWSNNLGFTFKDTSTAWRLIIIPFTRYGVGAGSPNLATVTSILFYLDNGVTGNAGYFWFDKIALEKGYQIDIKANNTNTTTARTANFSVIYITSPWLCISDYNTCVELQSTLPQGSTVYARLEGLLENPTKYLRFGRKRSCPNDACDWESSVNSADIIDTSWTPTNIPAEGSNIQAKGDYCIVSYIGVDTA